MMYAKIDMNGNVIEFPIDSLRDPQFDPSRLDIVEVDTETQRPPSKWDEKLLFDRVEKVGDTYFLYYNIEPRFSTTQEKREAIEKLVQYAKRDNPRRFEGIVNQIVSYVPQREAESWDQQVLEARQWTADNTATVPLVQSAATARGVTVAQYCEAILRKAGEYAIAYGTVLGKFHGNQDILDSIDLEDETTWDNYNNYNWNL